MLDTSRIHHIGVLVADVDEAILFMRDTFGLEVSSEVSIPAVPMRACLMQWGDIAVELVERGDPALRQEALGGARAKLDHVAVTVNDVEDAVATLREHAVTMETEQPILFDGIATIFTQAESSGGVRYQLLNAEEAAG